MQGHELQRYREVFAQPAALIPEITMVGWSRFLAADSLLGPHVHRREWEICHIIRGKVDWWAGDRVFAVGPGDFYVTAPGERHGGVDALMHPCELYWIQVRHETGSDLAPALRRLKAGHRHVFRSRPAVPEIFERIMEEHRQRRPDAAAAARVWVHALLLEVLRAQEAARSAGGLSPEIARALSYLQNAPDEGLPGAAAAAGLALSRFHERFRAETGYTPGEYRARLRVERAKKLLRQDQTTVTDIAHALGFSTSQYFATSFRRYTGMSPAAYRRHATPPNLTASAPPAAKRSPSPAPPRPTPSTPATAPRR